MNERRIEAEVVLANGCNVIRTRFVYLAKGQTTEPSTASMHFTEAEARQLGYKLIMLANDIRLAREAAEFQAKMPISQTPDPESL